MPERSGWRMNAWAASAVYALLAVVTTWPLVTRISSAIAWDMGDPALNCWILQWTMGQMLAALHGHPAALLDYWNGNIFYPAKLTLAYSEHLTAQALEALPLFAATGNILLCYNLLVLSTVALSGLAVFLLVRELTGHPMAAFVAGAAFALTPYRVSQLSHLQMLSGYWMPLAIYGFRRFFVTSRLRPLAWGAAAVVLQNLSCGYLMLFFAPFACAYCVYEVAARGLWRSRRTWLALGGAAVGIALLTYPFVAPYLELRRISALGVRSIGDVVSFSADVYAYVRSADVLRLWGGVIGAHPAGEGECFQGLTVLVLAAVGAAAAARQRARGGAGSGAGFFAVAAVAAALFSLGPVIHVDGQPIGAGPYALLYRFVPGYDGLRVPARFAMLVALFLAVLAGYGAAAIVRRWRRAGAVALAAAVVCIVAESWIVPFYTNLGLFDPNFQPAPPLVAGAQVSSLYRAVRSLPAGTVLVEFPFGQTRYDIEAMFYAGYHRKPILNGYSGFSPPTYGHTVSVVNGIVQDSQDAWNALMSAGVTHAIVHEHAYLGGVGGRIAAALAAQGAREIAASDGDVLFALRPPASGAR